MGLGKGKLREDKATVLKRTGRWVQLEKTF